jgi:hypothetical protein
MICRCRSGITGTTMVWVPVQSALTEFVPVPGSVLDTAFHSLTLLDQFSE